MAGIKLDLDKCKELIGEAYRRNTQLKHLVYFVYEVPDRPRMLPHSVGKPGGGFVRQGGSIEPGSVLTMRDVTPVRIRRIVKLSGLTAMDDAFLKSLCNHLGGVLAGEEISVLLQGLSKYSERKFSASSKGKLTTSDLQPAQDWISSNGYSADRLMIPSNQRDQLFTTEQQIMYLMHAHEDLGHFFVGRIGNLAVFWHHELTKIAIMYESFEATFYKTKFEVYYDPEEEPPNFAVEEWCAAGPTSELNAAVIEF